MKRLPSHVPSPTLTVFSGSSNYRRTEPWRKVQDLKGPTSVPAVAVDHRQVWKIQYEELGRYLESYLASGTRVSLSFFDLM